MTRLKRLWSTWVGIWDHHEHPRSLAFIRVGVALCVLWDFGWMAAMGLAVPILGPEEAGGWARVLDRGTVPLIWQVLPPTPGSAWLVWGAVMALTVCVLVGAFTPLACVLLVLLYAQTAQTLDAADRGIDTLLRIILLLLAASGSHRTLSVDAWRRTGSWAGDGADVPSWPRHVIIVQLVVMYFTAGIAKVGSGWTPMGHYSALYVILQDPAVARFDWSFLAAMPLYRFTQLATFVTILWEYSAPLVVLLYWYRHTADRPGRLRAFSNRWRLHWWWLSVGVIFHVGIAVTLNLGIFPFAMLALYPAFVHPAEWWWVRPREALHPAFPPVVEPGSSSAGASWTPATTPPSS